MLKKFKTIKLEDKIEHSTYVEMLRINQEIKEIMTLIIDNLTFDIYKSNYPFEDEQEKYSGILSGRLKKCNKQYRMAEKIIKPTTFSILPFRIYPAEVSKNMEWIEVPNTKNEYSGPITNNVKIHGKYARYYSKTENFLNDSSINIQIGAYKDLVNIILRESKKHSCNGKIFPKEWLGRLDTNKPVVDMKL